MRAPVLTDRALNRALLARQLLLERGDESVVDTVRRLVGLQGQAPLAPYVGLWSRLQGFVPQNLGDALEQRLLVRSTLMRGTVHLVTADDALVLRPLVEPAIVRGFRGGFTGRLTGAQEAAVIAFGRELLREAPRTRAELRRAFDDRWPQLDEDAMAYAISYLVPTVQPTPRGVWGKAQRAAQLALLEAWVGRPLADVPSIDAIVLRYLAAFGPASVNDAQAWSGLTGLREVFDRLAPQLHVFSSEGGQVLYDVPDALRPEPEHPAPPRFLPEYDNVLLSHRDRGRIIDTEQRVPLPPGNGAREGTFLSDGYLRGTWRVEGGVLRIRPYRALPDAAASEIVGEAQGLAAFLGVSVVDLTGEDSSTRT